MSFDNSIKNKRIISFMAGINIDTIRSLLNFDGEIIRAMPNLAISSGYGIIGYTKTVDIDIIRIFEGLGFAFTVDEADIEKITAYSACGLGFAAYVLESFVLAGKTLGLNEELCKQIVIRNFENAIETRNFNKTVSAVATKGGATEQGLQYLHDNNLQELINGAIMKAYDKMR